MGVGQKHYYIQSDQISRICVWYCINIFVLILSFCHIQSWILLTWISRYRDNLNIAISSLSIARFLKIFMFELIIFYGRFNCLIVSLWHKIQLSIWYSLPKGIFRYLVTMIMYSNNSNSQWEVALLDRRYQFFG